MAGNMGRGRTPVADGPTCPLPGRHTCTGGGYLGVDGRTRCRNLIPVRGLGHFLPPTQQETRMSVVLLLSRIAHKEPRGHSTSSSGGGQRG